MSRRSRDVAAADNWSPAATVGQLIVAAALGTVGVPALVGDAAGLGGPEPPSSVWLAAAAALVLWLLALAPGLDRTVRAILARAPWSSVRRSPRPRGTSIVDSEHSATRWPRRSSGRAGSAWRPRRRSRRSPRTC